MMKISNETWFVALLLFVIMAFGSANAEILPTAASTAGFTFTRNLMLGVQGDDVSALQQFLIAGGYLKVPAPTGYFGSLTKVALGAWQASVGISPSAGYFGSISRGKINTAIQSSLIDETGAQNAVGTTSVTVETTTAAIGTTNVAVAEKGSGLPVRLTIPKLNVDAGFQYNGLKSDGTMEIPSNIYDVGWFTGSVRPGEKGVSIITGHVAQVRRGVVTKLGVFSNLKTLSAGDKLTVLNDKGNSITFVVREIRSYDPAADATDVFTAGGGGAHLNLITCEGSWNQDQLSYSQRLVVFTDLAQ